MNRPFLSPTPAHWKKPGTLRPGLIGTMLATILLWQSGLHAAPPATTPPAAPPATVSPEQQTLDFLKANEPEVYQSAVLLQAKDPQKFSALMKDMSKDVKKLLDMGKQNHEKFAQTVLDRRLAYRALQLAKDLRNEGLSPDVRKQKNDELNSVLNQQFDIRRKLRMMEIDDFAARVNKLQEQLNNMKHQFADGDHKKEDLVNERI